MRRLALSAAAWMILSSCGYFFPWRNSYLNEGVEKLSSDEIMQRMGPPHGQSKLAEGAAVWLYQYRDSSVSSDHMGRVSGGSSCTEYILIFDQRNVLKSFRRQGC